MEDRTSDDPTSVPRIKIRAITLADGKTHHLPPIGVTAIVGGNNTGKSTLLAQLNQRLHSGPAYAPQNQYQILNGVELDVKDSLQDFYAWVQKNARFMEGTANPHQEPGYARVGSARINPNFLSGIWHGVQRGELSGIAQLMVYYADAGARSAVGFSSSMRQRPDDPPSNYLHYLEDDDSLRQKVSDLYFDIFGQRLTLDKLGLTTTLRIGDAPPGLEKLSYYDNPLPFRQALDKLSRLDQQGDGMRALLGLLLPLITATYPIIIVDEPEAFLHPPQAIKLGKILGSLSRDIGVQVVLATHDRNILIGLLQSNAVLSVIRLTRQNDATGSHILSPDRIAEIWSDPVLKYSHVLDGLFHSRVVVAENERDCTFYAAALDAAHEESPLPIQPSEILFVPTGGKDGLAPVVKALAELKVPVVASPDIDMLDDETKMKRLTEALGADWSLFSKDYHACTRQFRRPRSSILAANVAASIQAIIERTLNENPMRKWDSELRDEIKSAARAEESPWWELKKYGVRAFSKEIDVQALQFFDRLDAIGLVLVREGELESFATGFQVSERKGINWLRSALEKEVHHGSAAKDHVRRLASVQTLALPQSE